MDSPDRGAAALSSVREARVFHARAPAKINLGLELLGKRPDGFHEIRSILVMVALCDDIDFRHDDVVHQPSIRGVKAEDNLIGKAIRLFRDYVPETAQLGYTVTKRIPIAAGLGGASSDAATTLRTMNHIHGFPLNHQDLHRIAATLGSDVPFFLDGPGALARGTGTELSPVPVPSSDVLLVVPDVTIARKTASLYGMIGDRHFSSGQKVQRTVARLSEGLLPDPGDLENAFSEPLYALVPELSALPAMLKSAGCSRYGLSGAGPAHYALLAPHEMPSIASRLESECRRRRFRIIRTAFLADPLSQIETD